MTAAEFREIRKSAGMTQAQLGAKLGVHYLTISRYERGICKIPFVMAIAVQTFRADHANP